MEPIPRLKFPNPAPKAFELMRRKRTLKPLKHLLVVSNHLPEELKCAFDILEKDGIIIERIGRPTNSRRLLPTDLQRADAVVNIGKAAQYALRAGCHIYLYDRFAGLG